MQRGDLYDDNIRNPMRFDIRIDRYRISDYLRNNEFDDKQVTEIVCRPDDGDIYVHWEYSDNE